MHAPKASAPAVRAVSTADQAKTLANLIAEVPAVVLLPSAVKHIEALEEIPRATKLPTEELVNQVLDIAWNFLKAVDSAGKFAKPVSFFLPCPPFLFYFVRARVLHCCDCPLSRCRTAKPLATLLWWRRRWIYPQSSATSAAANTLP